jgi:methyltransferase OMS1
MPHPTTSLTGEPRRLCWALKKRAVNYSVKHGEMCWKLELEQVRSFVSFHSGNERTTKHFLLVFSLIHSLIHSFIHSIFLYSIISLLLLGLNLDKYVASQITSLTLVDISEGMLAEAQERVSKTSGIQIKFVKADATSELVDRFGVDAFDTVVDSFSLCVMGTEGARRCLDQVSRVVKQKSQVLLLENSRSSNPLLGLYQDATADAAAMAGGKGCVYNQDVGALIRGTGRLIIKEEQSFAAGLFRSFVCVRND